MRRVLQRRDTEAFTLVELLVVITIIGILVALLIPAVMSAQRTARSARIKMEIDQLSTAIEDFRNDVGTDYPPNTNLANANAVVRYFKQAFPRHKEPENLIRRLAGATISANPGGGTETLAGGMSPAEAVVFWLGGFSSDPKYPISGPGGPSFIVGGQDNIEDRNRSFDFEIGRIGARDGLSIQEVLTASNPFQRFLTYTVTVDGVNQTRQINLWQYFPPKSTKPFVYFDTSRAVPNADESAMYVTAYESLPAQEADLATVAGLAPIKRLSTTAGATPTVADIRYANEDKFQILHAGVDDEWGGDVNGDNIPFDQIRLNFTSPGASLNSFSPLPLLFPDGPFLGELGDTVVNFDERTLQDAQP